MPVMMSNFMPALPEIFMLIMTCFILLIDLWSAKRSHFITYFLVQLTLVVSAILVIRQYGTGHTIALNGMYVLDNLAIVLKLFILLTSFLALVYSRIYVRFREMPFGEYYILALLSVLGMMIIVSAYNLLVVFLGLELFSLPLYAMVALQRNSAVCTEAAIKYFIIGAIASGMLLYGLSMIYGSTKSLDIATVAATINQTAPALKMLMIFGLVFVVVGIAFKLGAVPFHMWVPDVYEGAPSAVVLFLGTAPKLAAIGLLYRLLIDAMPGLFQQWHQLLIVISLLSMALGNIAAIVQNNLKRMLAYSSIAHMGYMLLGLIAGTAEGYGAALFYMFTYALMTLGGFGLLVIMSKAGYEAEQINDLRGLNSRNPWLAFMMLITMFSLAGIPPLVGFMAKVSVLEALISVHIVWLAAVAILFAIIGAYYYIRVVKVMYFETAQETMPIQYAGDLKLAISITGLLLLLLGMFPGYLFHLCQTVF